MRAWVCATRARITHPPPPPPPLPRPVRAQEHDQRTRGLIRDKTEALRSALGALTAGHAAAAALEEEVVARFALAAALKPQVDALTASVAALTASVAERDAALAARDATIAGLTADVARGAALEAEFSEVVAEWQAEVARLSGELDARGRELEEERVLREGTAEDLAEARASQSQGAQANARERDNLRAEVEGLRAAARDAAAAATARSDALQASLDAATASLANTQAELRASESRVATLSRERDVACAETAGLQRRLDQEIKMMGACVRGCVRTWRVPTAGEVV